MTPRSHEERTQLMNTREFERMFELFLHLPENPTLSSRIDPKDPSEGEDEEVDEQWRIREELEIEGLLMGLSNHVQTYVTTAAGRESLIRYLKDLP